jgi:hypothetical protein
MDVNPEAMGERPGALGDYLIASGKASLPLGRRLAGYALAAVLAPLLTLLLAILRSRLNLTTDALAFLVAVIAVAPATSSRRHEAPGMP